MCETIELTFVPGQAPERLDRFLARTLPDISRAQLKRLIETEQINVDNTAVKAGLRLRGGENIQIVLPQVQESDPTPEDLPLDILYEDSDLIVLNKAAGMVVHPADGHTSGTLVNALLHHCPAISGVGGTLRSGIVHRLDKDTSGVLVVCKTDLSHQALAQQFKAHSVVRQYVTLVHGQVQNSTGTIDKSIGRHPNARKKMSTQSTRGRRAVTHWEVLRRYATERLSLLQMRLETGRTHQIRVHLADMNLPVVGDQTYGNPKRANTITDPQIRILIQQLHRQALHARVLGFIHPSTGEYMEFSAPLPEDLALIITALDEKYSVETPLEFQTIL
ncbi:MAG: RluA family pseudouridine synthase [Desulfuromonadaceae bacterium]|nr:RluA family pseudouridine synthase [Desulfuromonadaceae bacterium]